MDIGIIGGGASGMMLAALLNKSNKVTIIERNHKLGKKLLLTGNGKCNFTSGDFDDLEDIYNNDFAIEIYKKHDFKEMIKFFNSIGVEEKIEIHRGHAYYYPRSNKATSVYYALFDKLSDNEVRIVYDTQVKDITLSGDKFNVVADGDTYSFDKLVIATGGKSYKNTGSDGNLYSIISKLGHKIIKPLPALVGFRCDDKDIKSLKGVRVDACVTVHVEGDDEFTFFESGEVQFTENYISGIPIMNLSRKANRYISDGKNVSMRFDFCSDIPIDRFDKRFDALVEKLRKRKNDISYREKDNFLSGFLPDEISYVIMKRSSAGGRLVSDIDDGSLKRIAQNILNFNISNISIGNFDTAQITIGGVSTDEIDRTTLESKIIKGLYFIGEVIDIDGKCGGYNLQLDFSTAKAVSLSLDN